MPCIDEEQPQLGMEHEMNLVQDQGGPLHAFKDTQRCSRCTRRSSCKRYLCTTRTSFSALQYANLRRSVKMPAELMRECRHVHKTSRVPEVVNEPRKLNVGKVFSMRGKEALVGCIERKYPTNTQTRKPFTARLIVRIH